MESDEARALWNGVQENIRRLDACVGPHTWEDLSPGRSLGKRYLCRLCKGEVDHVNRIWYDRGLAHGRRSTASPPKEK